MMYAVAGLVFVAVLYGCSSSGDVRKSDDNSQMRCVGYCDLTISEKSTAARLESSVEKAKIESKTEDKEDDEDE